MNNNDKTLLEDQHGISWVVLPAGDALFSHNSAYAGAPTLLQFTQVNNSQTCFTRSTVNLNGRVKAAAAFYTVYDNENKRNRFTISVSENLYHTHERAIHVNTFDLFEALEEICAFGKTPGVQLTAQ